MFSYLTQPILDTYIGLAEERVKRLRYAISERMLALIKALVIKRTK